MVKRRALPGAAPPASPGWLQTTGEVFHILWCICGKSSRRCAGLRPARELDGLLSEAELAHVHTLVEQLLPLRQTREAEARWQLSTEEANLVDRLNRLYRAVHAQIPGGGGSWGYASSRRAPAGRLCRGAGRRPPADLWEDVYRPLWAQVNALLPEGALDGFSRFTVFTDGLDETLAYVSPWMTQGRGGNWQWTRRMPGSWTGLPKPSSTSIPTTSPSTTPRRTTALRRAAPGTARRAWSPGPASYLMTSTTPFWTDYLHDRLANPDSYGFTSGTRRISSPTTPPPTRRRTLRRASPTLSVGRPGGDAVWEEKLNFFYRYPELVEFRTQARARLGL